MQVTDGKWGYRELWKLKHDDEDLRTINKTRKGRLWKIDCGLKEKHDYEFSLTNCIQYNYDLTGKNGFAFCEIYFPYLCFFYREYN